MIHSNRARVEKGVLLVDRKFHLGMERFLDALSVPILAVLPESLAGEQTMDLVEVAVEQLGYRVLTLKADGAFALPADEIVRLREEVLGSRLVYGGALGSGKIARQLGIPYIPILETDFVTQVALATSQVSNIARKLVHGARSAMSYVMHGIPDMRGAHSLHCNGYPIFDESRWFNANRLLYLDSRMSSAMVIPEARLKARLAARGGRPLRILFSGRYEPMKGADDAVSAVLASAERGLAVEMHCYGQGSLHPEMEQLAAQGTGGVRIVVHGSIPYPELVELSYTFDLFVACHIQGDPSCTYLEAFGAGLPIVGYGNRMWRRLSEESAAGYWSPLGNPDAVADNIRKLALDFEALGAMSEAARRFAAEHSFEREFRRRTDALQEALQGR